MRQAICLMSMPDIEVVNTVAVFWCGRSVRLVRTQVTIPVAEVTVPVLLGLLDIRVSVWAVSYPVEKRHLAVKVVDGVSVFAAAGFALDVALCGVTDRPSPSQSTRKETGRIQRKRLISILNSSFNDHRIGSANLGDRQSKMVSIQ